MLMRKLLDIHILCRRDLGHSQSRDLVAQYLRTAWNRFDKPDVPVKVGSGAQCQG